MGECLITIEYNDHVANLLDQIINKIDFLSPHEIEGVLYEIINESGISNNKLVQITGLPRETLKKLKSSLGFILEETTEDSINIREEIKSQLQLAIIAKPKWRLLEYSNEILSQYISNIRQNAVIKPKRELDQFFARPETTYSKCRILLDKIDLSKSNVALLGDDDLVSLGLAKLNQLPKKLTIFDIDEGLLNVIKTNFPKEATSTQFIKYDAKNEVPAQHINDYDVVITDPPYTKAGIALFLNRALDLLGTSSEAKPKYIFLYWGNSTKTPEKTLKIQEIITRMNLLIEDRVDKFAQYSGAESIGNNSAIYVLKLTPFTIKSSVPNINTNLYTFESAKEEKFPFVDHVTAKLYKVPTNLLNSKASLGRALELLCKAHRLKIVDTKTTKFKGEGMSITFILSNSNLLIHTWPELSAIHIDLITCAPIYDKVNFSNNLIKFFGTKAIELNFVE